MKWWGEIDLKEHMFALWELGPLRLAVQRLSDEWRLSYERAEDTTSDDEQWSHRIVTEDEAPAYAETERYVFQSSDNTLQILPALADRPVVSRPFVPFTVPAREEATIFVSTPLWTHIQVGNPLQTLQSIPIRQPSDTWFGPNTIEGELCYASRTYGRLRLSEIPLFPYRATTRLLIHNRANSPLLVQRVNLPVPFLSLFVTAEGRLWTEAVIMARTQDSSQADVEIQRSQPAEAAGAVLVAAPREQTSEALSIRAFGAIFRDATRWS